MGPTTDATPGPQAGAMLGSYLQPPASALEGDVPPGPSQRGLEPSRASDGAASAETREAP